MSKYIEFQEVKVTEPIEETTRNGWVKWGKDNLYPQYLVGLYYNSPIHGGIVNSKVKFISGGGLGFSGDKVEFERILSNGKSRYDLNEVARQLVLDYELFESYALLCRFDPILKFWYIDHLPVEKLRQDVDNTGVYYSDDWTRSRQDEGCGFRFYPSIFNRGESNEFVLFVKNDVKQYTLNESRKLAGNYYSSPSYSGALDSIHTDIEINFFRRAEVTNGYKGGTAISLNNGVPDSEEEAEKLMQSLKEQATDRNKQGGLVVLFSDGKENEPSILQLSGNDLDKRYESTEAGLMQKIMISHSVINPKLFGIISNNALSENDLLLDYQLFLNTYAQDRQKNIEDSINYIHKVLNNIRTKVVFNTFDVIKKTPVQEQSKQFSATDDVLEALDKVGSSKDGVKFVFSLPFEGQSDEEIITKFKVIDFASITKKQQDILGLISSGESYTAIAEATKLKPEQLAVEIMNLEKNGYLSGWEVTGKGLKEIASVETMEVVYSYEKRPDAPPLKGESREFCTELLRRNRIYQRSDIDQITDAVGRDVWSYRGGWYNNPETGKNQPSCRHYWQQHLIIKRK